MTTVAVNLDAAGSPTRPASGRRLRLAYNPVFLPEYLSTIGISLAISIPFLLHPVGGAKPILDNPHGLFGLASYLLTIGFLLGVTYVHRTQCSAVVLKLTPEGEVFARKGGVEVELHDLSHATERLGWFFGRHVRKLFVRDRRGHEFEVHDGMTGYSDFRRLVETLVRGEIEARDDEAPRAAMVARAWRERHAIFPVSMGASLGRAVFRFFFLIPVAFVDFIANLWFSFMFVGMGLPNLAVYSAAVTLLMAALVNRYVSYYLLSSRRMNR